MACDYKLNLDLRRYFTLGGSDTIYDDACSVFEALVLDYCWPWAHVSMYWFVSAEMFARASHHSAQKH